MIPFSVCGSRIPTRTQPAEADGFSHFRLPHLDARYSRAALRDAQNPCSPSSHLARSSTSTPSRV